MLDLNENITHTAPDKSLTNPFDDVDEMTVLLNFTFV